MSTILAIDPGNTESGYVIIDADTCKPLEYGKVDNDHLLNILSGVDAPPADRYVIEMVASYGMAVGADVFETCVWIGRFRQTIDHWHHAAPVSLIKRLPVKVHHCHTSKAKDSNITQALVDRFALGQSNHGKGTKANPGFFYGFKADIWAAFALAVYVADTRSDAS